MAEQRTPWDIGQAVADAWLGHPAWRDFIEESKDAVENRDELAQSVAEAIQAERDRHAAEVKQARRGARIELAAIVQRLMDEATKYGKSRALRLEDVIHMLKAENRRINQLWANEAPQEARRVND